MQRVNSPAPIFPVEHGISPLAGQVLESSLDLGTAEGRVPVPPVQGGGLPVEVLLVYRGAPHPGRTGGSGAGAFGDANPHTLRLGPGDRDARHPHLHLLTAGGSVLAARRTLGAHFRAGSCWWWAAQQTVRRVTPMQLPVQGYAGCFNRALGLWTCWEGSPLTV